jgi:hypothetical protein
VACLSQKAQCHSKVHIDLEQTRNCIKGDCNKQIRKKPVQLIKLSSRIRINKIKNQLLYNLKNKCGRAKKIKEF